MATRKSQPKKAGAARKPRASEDTHCIRMYFSVVEKKRGRFKLVFDSREHTEWECYEVAGRSTKIRQLFKEYNERFAEVADKQLSAKQIAAFIAKNTGPFTFTKID